MVVSLGHTYVLFLKIRFRANGIRSRENGLIIRANGITLQEMCCGFLLSREMWYRKSVLPGTGAG